MDVKRTFLTHTEASDLPPEFRRAVERFKIRGSSAKLNIALDRMPSFPAAPDHASFLRGDLHASASLAELERAYDDWKAGHVSTKPYIDMLIPSQIDPTMAPTGSHMMTVFVQYAPYDLEQGNTRSAANWDEAARCGCCPAPDHRRHLRTACSTRCRSPAPISASASCIWKSGRPPRSNPRSV